MRHYEIFSSLIALVILTAMVMGPEKGRAQETGGWWSAKVQQRITDAGQNKSELVEALNQVAEDQRDWMAFLVENMPQQDLRSLSSDYLLEDIQKAAQIQAATPWSISEELFLNYVLPYANVDETREAWRANLHAICQPLVKGCKTPGEAAQRLNEKLFGQIQVKYSTQRKRANQAPSESIEQGLASCTGLSILLVDACRSVGVPARLAGIPSWPNKQGNHTWVEVWDAGWHFTGAAEPSGQGLNHTWFQGDASLAKKDSRLNAIYAVSFKKTDIVFPMVWSRNPDCPVYAVNVTDRYTRKASDLAPGKSRVFVRVWNADRSKRLVVRVDCEKSASRSGVVSSGVTKAGTADMNDMLSFDLDQASNFQLRLNFEGKDFFSSLKTTDQTEQLVDISIDPSSPNPTSDELTQGLDEQIDLYFAADTSRNAPAFQFSSAAQKAYAAKPAAMRQRIWQRYLRSAFVRSRFKDDYDAKQVQFNEHLSPYTVKEVGKRPAKGWPLFIAMHGGGGAPARVNDSQWEIMQRYYKDQAGVMGYKYLALRAPNNTWNGFYADYVYPLIENLVRQMIAFGDVDPNKVFIMGYSHGGYGAFAIGPKIPYRFAAVHSSAAAPTGGETSGKTLRNTRFTFMVGETDTAYGRRQRCEAFAEQIEALKEDHPGEYPVEFLFKPGYGHGGLPDRDMIAAMYDYTRLNQPKNLTWEMTDSVVDQFDWLSVKDPAKGKMVEASIENNHIKVTPTNLSAVTVWMDSRLIDPGRPVVFHAFGQTREVDYHPNIKTFCESLRKTGDINLSYDFNVDLQRTAELQLKR